jgi:3-oxoacyl-[acyl-carrier protein] reductase
MQLDGKFAIITGGASGIGEATARMMTDRGARVAMLDIDEERMKRVAAEISGAMAINCDVRDSAAVDLAVAQAVKEFGRLDFLVNCAGPRGDEVKKLTLRLHGEQAAAEGGIVASKPVTNATISITDEAWRAEFAAVVDNVFYCTRAALKVMLPQKYGVIVSNSSIHGISGHAGVPHYSAAKAAINGFTRSVAKEVAAHGIRINSVAAGWVETPLFLRMTPESLQAAIKKMVPMGRVARAEEIAGTICFLCSDDSSYMTGQTISPNGGYIAI